MTAPPDDTTTDLHAVIAVLRADRDAAVAREAKRDSDYAERAAHQGATVEVLQAMAVSPGDPKPVFELIVRRARDLCDGYGASLAQVVDSSIVLHAYIVADEALGKRHEAGFPRPVAADTIFGRAILAREPVQIPDVAADETFALRESTLRSAVRALVAVPLIRNGEAIGAIDISRRQTGDFSQAQIELLQVLANQAVIAINSAEMYRALQTRTADLQETLEYQTATSDVLKVISRSTFDLEPVFQTVASTAVRLCNADQAGIYLHQNDEYRWAGGYSQLPEYERIEREVTIRPGTGTLVGRVALEGRPVQVLDAWNDTLYEAKEDAQVGGIHTLLGVPLLRDGSPIGVIGLGRQKIEPFTERQIELVSTFAAQAVIAMENARLLRELQEALDEQTATAEVLRVINASPGNLAPVFAAMLDKAARLTQSEFGVLATYDGSVFHAFSSEQSAPETLNPEPGSALGDLVDGAPFIHIPDVMDTDAYRARVPSRVRLVEGFGARTCLWIPMRKDDALLGVLASYRREVRPFSDRQIYLLQNFAAQAVIAMENARLITEQREALEQQTATAEVLQVINASLGDLAPVFDAMLEKAMRLCKAACGGLFTYDGEKFQTVATRGVPAAMAEFREKNPPTVQLGGHVKRLLETQRPVHILDWTEGETYRSGDVDARAIADLGGARTNILVPLLKDEGVIGFFGLYRQEVQAFTDKQIALLENFAAQAVIAMENARLLTETREALEQQTATAEVLQVINTSPGNLAPVFDAMLDKALLLCGASFGDFAIFDGSGFLSITARGWDPGRPTPLRASAPVPGMAFYRIIQGEDIVHIPDITADEVYRSGNPLRRRLADHFGARTVIWVSLRKDKTLLGAFVIYRTEVRPFTDRQIALLQNFAAQAVIGMENARLLNEIRQRQEELRITFENMGDGVALFDEALRLVAWNRSFQEILDVPDEVIASRLTYADYIRYLAERGEYGPRVDPEAQLRHFQERAREHYTFERIRPDGRIIEVRHNPVPGGGFVLIYADITERKRSEAEIRAARDAAEEASRTIEAAYRELKTAQANLIQAEKMASLGQLTAGIAHEIKNPLNFVNNFSALSTELIDELRDVLAPEPLGEAARTEVNDLTALLKGNLEKVVQHGQRADGIVRSMLDHSRGSSGERRTVDLNALIDEALNLAYHGARAQDQSFNITLERDFGVGIATIEVNPQDITRVFLNLFANGFYATTKRALEGGDADFVPTLKVTTIDAGDAVEIRVRDNGTGIPVDIRDKLFQPFFTTKPTGEGTGLGLSITYDIVTQQHGGSIAVASIVGEYSEFTIRLPRDP